MDKLLPYYEQELSLFMRQSKAFAEAYPKVANRLIMTGESVEDPHVERLIQAFSLIAARIHKKLDDGYENFTSALFEVLYPAYLKPFPSCSIVALEQGIKLNQLTEPVMAPKGMKLITKPHQGVSCRFSTAYPVTLLPLELDKLEFKLNPVEESQQDTNACLKLHFNILSAGFDVMQLVTQRLRLYLDATPFGVAHLRDLMLDPATKVHAGNTFTVAKPIKNPFSLAGFSPDDALLPSDQHTHHAYRLITEYFAFPEKFNFINLSMQDLKFILTKGVKDFSIELKFRLDSNNNKLIQALGQLNTKNIRLFCTPVINLFKKPAEPIKINHKQVKYHVVGDVHHPQFYEIYAINRLSLIREAANRQQSLYEVLPFYSLNHARQQQHALYYHLERDQSVQASQSGYDYQITLVDHQFDPSTLQADYLSLDLWCTNRHLPQHIPFGLAQGDLTQEDTGPFRQVRFLKKPTPTYRFNHAKEDNWRIISHLSLNTQAFSNQSLNPQQDTRSLKEALTLYELTHSAYNLKQIEGFKAISCQPATTMVPATPYPMFIRGVEIRVAIEESSFIGTGRQLIGQLLSHFFGLRVNLNSFIQVVLVDDTTGQELLKCQPLNGFRQLV